MAGLSSYPGRWWALLVGTLEAFGLVWASAFKSGGLCHGAAHLAVALADPAGTMRSIDLKSPPLPPAVSPASAPWASAWGVGRIRQGCSAWWVGLYAAVCPAARFLDHAAQHHSAASPGGYPVLLTDRRPDSLLGRRRLYEASALTPAYHHHQVGAVTLALRCGWPDPTVVSALVVGWITLSMSGHHPPLATIAWGLSLYYLMGNMDALGKYDGILTVSLSILGWTISRGAAFSYWPGAWCCWQLCTAQLLDSRTGRCLAMRSFGADGRRPQAYTPQAQGGHLLGATVLAGVSGWLFAFQLDQPSPFGLKMGIEYLFMAVLGGVGYVWGAISGALMTNCWDWLRVLLPKLIGTSLGGYEVIVFGDGAGAAVEYLPDGVWSLAGRLLPAPQRVPDWQALPRWRNGPNRWPARAGCKICKGFGRPGVKET